MSLLLFLSVSVSGFVFVSTLYSNSLMEAHRGLEERLSLLADRFSLPVRRYLQATQAMAGLPELVPVLETGGADSLEKANYLIDHERLVAGTDVCYIMDSQGNTVASTNRDASDSFVGKNYAFRQYFKTALQGRPAVQMALGITSRQRGFYFSAPIYGTGREAPIGVLVNKVPVNFLGIEGYFHSNNNDILVLVSPEGVILASSRSDWLYKTLWKTSDREMQQIIETRQFGDGPWPWVGIEKISDDTAKDALGNEYMIYNRALEYFPGWKLMYFHDKKRHHSIMSGRLLERSGYMILFLCLIFGLAFYILYKDAIKGITARKKTEEALKASEVKYRTLVENSTDVIARFDRELKYLYVSPSLKKYLNIDTNRLAGKNYRDLGFPKNLCDLWDQEIHQAFAKGRPVESEFDLMIGDRKQFFNLRLFPEFDDHGEIQSVLSVIRDITAHRATEQEYRTLFNEMLDGFALHEIICDNEGRPADYLFLAVNPAFERLTGLKAEDIVGRTVLDVLPDTEAYWIETYGRVALTGEAVHFENYSQALDRHFEVTAYCPQMRRFACIFVDITGRKRAEEDRARLEDQLRQSQKMEAIGTLAGGIAHDFNNILSAILGYTEMALMDIDENGPIHENLLQVKKAGNRAKLLVQQILAFSRKAQQDKIALDIAPLVEESLKFLRASLPATIEIKKRLDPGRGHIYADPTQVQQVLMNLCSNAAQAMNDSGGILELSVAAKHLSAPLDGPLGQIQPGHYLVLAVKDTGEGIAPEDYSRIFDPFFTTKPPGSGTGMGLAAVHGIVRSHGGGITFSSKVGLGSCFEVYLPLLETKTEDPTAQADKKIETGDERILFVDDEEALANVGQKMLERLGYKVTVKTSSLEALQVFQDNPDNFDLIITDQTMPKMTGAALAREILKIEPKALIVLCTGYSDAVSAESAKEIGIKRFLMKPLALADVARTIREVLDNSG